ncbi:hypothetical protein ACLFMI_10530 [Pseudonocardia nantongensis]|uniref:hypothetical protein n=1 Tax=Pseudonocardia nantongensis TaxID=1181885 RepID=UPI00397C0141
MRFALDALSTAVPAAQIDEARAFYAARPVGRGPSTLEQLHELRAHPAVAEPVDLYLDIDGGGFYLDSAARSDARHDHPCSGCGIGASPTGSSAPRSSSVPTT